MYPYLSIGSGLEAILYVALLVLAGASMLASLNVKSTFARYSKVNSYRGLTGAEAATKLLRENGLSNVGVEQVSGELTDHFDPRSNTVRLSSSVYNNTSIAAISVACHEVGHAIQHSLGYAPLKFRSTFFPIASIGTRLGMPLVLLGFMLSFTPLIDFGILFFSFAVIFQIITLPVEFNASDRAIKLMLSHGIIADDESRYSKKVLSAAALTYVAAAASAIVSLLRLIVIRNNRE